MLALALVELVVFQGLEVKRRCKVEGMIHNRAAFGLRGSADETAFQIGQLRQEANLGCEGLPLCRSEILAEPEKCAVDEHANRAAVDVDTARA